MVSNMSPVQLDELTGSPSTDFSRNYNTLAEREGIQYSVSYFRSPLSAELCAKHEEN